MRPMRLASVSVNHTFPSGPAAMSLRSAAPGTAYSAMAPAGVIRPILPAPSVNHRLSSGPRAMSRRAAFGVGTGNSVTLPAGVMRATLPFPALSTSVNHMLPSGPAAMPLAPAAPAGCGNSVTAPLGVMRATLPANDSATQRLPSGPAAMAFGLLDGLGRGNSVKCGPLAGGVVVVVAPVTALACDVVVVFGAVVDVTAGPAVACAPGTGVTPAASLVVVVPPGPDATFCFLPPLGEATARAM